MRTGSTPSFVLGDRGRRPEPNAVAAAGCWPSEKPSQEPRRCTSSLAEARPRREGREGSSLGVPHRDPSAGVGVNRVLGGPAPGVDVEEVPGGRCAPAHPGSRARRRSSARGGTALGAIAGHFTARTAHSLAQSPRRRVRLRVPRLGRPGALDPAQGAGSCVGQAGPSRRRFERGRQPLLEAAIHAGAAARRTAVRLPIVQAGPWIGAGSHGEVGIPVRPLRRQRHLTARHGQVVHGNGAAGQVV